MEEVWKPVKVRNIDFSGYYEVNNFGVIRSIERYDMRGHKVHFKIIKQRKNKKGYYQVNLSKDKIRLTRVFVHRIVAESFIPNPNNLPQVGHKDDLKDKSNNCVDNLYWTTNIENSRTKGRRERLSDSHKGEKSYNRRAVICDDKEFPTLTSCAEYYNITASYLCSFLNKRAKMPEKFKKMNLRYKN